MADEPTHKPTSEPILPEQGQIASPGPPILPAALAYPSALGSPTVLPVQAQQLQIWQGPYPPPEAIERYEKILPGSFDQILGMVERLQTAQIEQSKTALQNTRDDTKRCHWLGFSLGVIACLGAITCLAFGYPWVAATFLSVPVMGVANALIGSVKAPATQPAILPTIQPGPPVPRPVEEKSSAEKKTASDEKKV